jgi:hypothetical protein
MGQALGIADDDGEIQGILYLLDEYFLGNGDIRRRCLVQGGGLGPFFLIGGDLAHAHGHIDDRDGDAEVHGILRRPFAGTFGAGLVEDHIHETVAGLVILFQEDVPGDLDEEGLQLAVVPVLVYFVQLIVVEAQAAMQQVIGLADQLHDRILDAVMHHFHIVARCPFPQVGDTGFAVDLGGHGLQDRLDILVSHGIAAGHNAGAGAGALFTAGDTDSP